MFDAAATQRLLDNLGNLTAEEMANTIALLDEIDARKRKILCQNDLLAFIAAVDPAYKFGAHLKRLGGLLMHIDEGTKDRLAVSMAPRFGKSQMISIYFPAWYIGRHPDHKVIMASHTADLAVDMARKVRNLMQTQEYKSIFPGVAIAADAKAAGKWNTTKGGEVFAAGVGGALAGRGGHLCVVDDPLSEQDLKAGNTSSLDVTYEWFRAGLRTRLMPGGRICVLHCLTGGTLVRLASGEDKPIRDVRPGDMVVSYKDSKYTAAKVIGWSNQGLDRVYTVALKSGNIIRGNWKHPLLVSFHGEEKWVTLKNLTPGMQLVSTKVAQTRRIPRPFEGCAKAATTKSGKKRRPLGGCSFESSIRSISVLLKGALTLPRLQQNPARASSATAWSGITKSTLTPQGVLSGTTGNGRVKFVLQKAVAALCRPKVFAVSVGVKPTTTRARPKARTTAQLNGVTRISKCNTESPGQLTTGCLQSKEGSVRYAGSLRMTETLPLSGKCGGSPWITAMLPERFVRYCVTPAISWLKNATRQIYYGRQLRILSATFDEVVSVTIGGDEEVFDIQVEGTESFLANGVVSHNTRWHARDLIGRLVKDAAMNPDADQYEVFEFPAILDTPNPVADPTALDFDPEAPATIQKSLWPEQWSLESLLRTKASMPAWQWNAQYMQTPTAQEAAVIKRDDIRWWPDKEPPKVDFTVQGWDTALTTKERSDYSVCQTWGVWTTDEGVTNVILLNRVKGKYEFPELKKVAFEQAKEWQPDSLIIETKASGQPLVDELRRSGVFVQEYSPGKGQDKLARMNAISDMYASHQVWFPETRWATEVVEELVAFPSGEHDDECDAMTLCLMRIRKGGLLKLASDHEDPERPFAFSQKRAYY